MKQLIISRDPSRKEIDHELLTFELEGTVKQTSRRFSKASQSKRQPATQVKFQFFSRLSCRSRKFEKQLRSSNFQMAIQKPLERRIFSITKSSWSKAHISRAMAPTGSERDAAIPILLQLDGSDGLLTYDRYLHKLEGTVHVTAKKFFASVLQSLAPRRSRRTSSMSVPNTVDLIKSRTRLHGAD